MYCSRCNIDTSKSKTDTVLKLFETTISKLENKNKKITLASDGSINLFQLDKKKYVKIFLDSLTNM